MQESGLNQYIENLQNKNEKLCEILDYTNSKDFKISEKEVEHISLYLKKRERLFTELNKIIEKIKQLEQNQDLMKSISKSEVDDLSKKSNILINDIIKKDKSNQETFEKIFALVKSNIKNTKDTAKINNSYFSVYNSSFVGNNFDSSR